MIIDSDNYKAAGIETLFFPGGEPHVKVPDYRLENIFLHLKLRTWNDVGLAACVIETLGRRDNLLRTFIPYFPGARQDKKVSNAPFTVGIMASLLNNKGFTWVFDPHSKMVEQHQPCYVYMPKHLPIPKMVGVAGVIAPDLGATARATQFRNKFCPGADVVQCYKHRNQDTGELSGYFVPPLTRVGRYIIVDDICDGGGTFNLLVKEVKKQWWNWVRRLELFVSHGIFSKGLDAIDPLIEHITTTDSWCTLKSSERLTVIPLVPNLFGLEGDICSVDMETV